MIEQHPGADRGLAPVIPLLARPRAQEAQRSEEILERRAGAGWRDIPDDVGRSARRLELLLAAGPTAVEPEEALASVALAHAGRIVTAASGVLELLGEEGPVLAEALGSDVMALPFSRLHEVADAVVELGLAPRAEPAWAGRAEAQAAAVVLEVSESDLRSAASAHASLYERFSESIWDVDPALLQAGRRRWRLLTRARLRRELRAASRTGRVPGRLGAVLAEVLAAHGSRERLTGLSPLLAHHLRDLDRGPLSDVDAAIAALRAVRRLQDALGDLLDPRRLERLLLADAFRCHDVVGPAVSVRTILQAWRNDVHDIGGQRAWDLDAASLEEWSLDVATSFRGIESVNDAVEALGAEPQSLRSLVDTLLLRQHVAEQEASGRPEPAGRHPSVVTSISGGVS